MGRIHNTVRSARPLGGKCKIALVGEAPGRDEALRGRPFVGASGQLLDQMLKHAGIKRSQCLVANVFSKRPRDNEVERFFMKKQQSARLGWDKKCKYGPFGARGYVREEHEHELERLKKEIEEASPEIVVAMGAAALWALTGYETIGKHRGVVLDSTLVPGVKVLATWHPAFVLRVFKMLPVVVLDLRKARNYAETRATPPEIELWLEPTLDDIREFKATHIDNCDLLSWDIETEGKQMTCIGFAPRPDLGIVIPFFDKQKFDWSYWGTLDEELEALGLVRDILQDPTTPKVGQNISYDLQWVIGRYGIKPRGLQHDTMLLHHSLQPEMQKSLGFLSSVYLNHPPWKEMVDFKTSENKDDA